MSAGPIFVLGPERSGANLLAWSLGQHPALEAGVSSRWLGPFLRDLDRLFDEATVDDRAQLTVRGVTRDQFHSSFGEVALRLMAGSPADQPSARLVDSTPGHAFHVFALRRLFPDARFIHIVRDVSSVVRLLVDKDIGKLFRSYYGEKKAYEHWISSVRACLGAERALGSGTVLRVLHRDLVADPEAVLRRCLVFIGEEWHRPCLLPVDSLVAEDGQSGSAEGEDDERPGIAFRDDAEVLSRSLLEEPTPAYPPDPVLAAELERVSLELDSRSSTPSDVGALVARVRKTMEAVIPAESHALVISRGDDRLLELNGRLAAHFPQGSDGQYLGYHPADGAEAVAGLEALRRRGAQFLVIPSTSFWWLEHYGAFRRHLDERYAVVTHEPEVCVIYSLDSHAGVGLDRRPTAAGVDAAFQDPLSRRLDELQAELLAVLSELASARAGSATKETSHE